VQDQPRLALPWEDEDEKPKLDHPTKEHSHKNISKPTYKTTQERRAVNTIE
jgi:hypothetical protein